MKKARFINGRTDFEGKPLDKDQLNWIANIIKEGDIVNVIDNHRWYRIFPLGENLFKWRFELLGTKLDKNITIL